MSSYLEIPEWSDQLHFRSFLTPGDGTTYPHWHKEIEIIYAYQGQVTIGAGSELVTLAQGELYYFSSGEPHYFLPSPDSLRWVFQFDLTLLDNALLDKSMVELVEIFERRVRHSRDWPEGVCQKLLALLLPLYEAGKAPVNRGQVLGYLYLLEDLFTREVPQLTDGSKSHKSRSQAQYKETIERLNRLYDYIENHFNEPITVQDAAALLGFSPYYFTRFFKENTGTTFMRFVNEYRLNQASYILANEKVPMTEVAERSGFASVKTFHHVFKGSKGISPLQYQKQQQKK